MVDSKKEFQRSMRRRFPIALKIFLGFMVIMFFVMLGNIFFRARLNTLDNLIQSTSAGMRRVALSQNLRKSLPLIRRARGLFNISGITTSRDHAESVLSQLDKKLDDDKTRADRLRGDREPFDSLYVNVSQFLVISRDAISVAEDSSAITAYNNFTGKNTRELLAKINETIPEVAKSHRLSFGTRDISNCYATVDSFLKPLFEKERFARLNHEFHARAESLAVLSALDNKVPVLILTMGSTLDSLFNIEIETGIIQTRWDTVYWALGDTLENILVRELALLGNTLESSRRAVDSTTNLYKWGIPSLLIFGLIIAFSIAGKIASPIARLRSATHKARRGEWDAEIEKTTNDEIGDLTDDFNAMIVELGKLDKMKSRFLASITHDLKSPIGRVRGNIVNLQDGLLGPVTEGQAELLDMMSRDVDKLSRLIHDILDLQKMRAGAFKLDIQDVEVKSFLFGVLEQHSGEFFEKEIELGVKIDFEKLDAQFDPKQIERVIDNLITNALKFTTPGGKIIVESVRNITELIVKVYDTGVGIPKEHVERIFGEFYQVEDTAKPAKGTGLGLAISKQIIEEHSGRIWAESMPGAGTCFGFAIPVSRLEV
ncbi:MAG TPA: HAMP domain-containing histidine kinase [candidate division Zixibacteria bacterium]|nr:HAMP domain-containing histidine kinase [candidate division Zixibacteria bacterium]